MKQLIGDRFCALDQSRPPSQKKKKAQLTLARDGDVPGIRSMSVNPDRLCAALRESCSNNQDRFEDGRYVADCMSLPTQEPGYFVLSVAYRRCKQRRLSEFVPAIVDNDSDSDKSLEAGF